MYVLHKIILTYNIFAKKKQCLGRLFSGLSGELRIWQNLTMAKETRFSEKTTLTMKT